MVALGEVVFEKIFDYVEDGAIEHRLLPLDQPRAEDLGKLALAQAGRADQKDVPSLVEESPGGQIVHAPAVYRGREGEVEASEGSEVAEVGGFDPPPD